MAAARRKLTETERLQRQEFFRELLCDLDMTTEELSEELDVHAVTVRKWASGSYPIPKTVLMAVQYIAYVEGGEEVG